jgi:hypothetical protein
MNLGTLVDLFELGVLHIEGGRVCSRRHAGDTGDTRKIGFSLLLSIFCLIP